MSYPIVLEDESSITVIYSPDEPVHTEEDDGVIIYYSRLWDVVKIVIKKDERHHIICF